MQKATALWFVVTVAAALAAPTPPEALAWAKPQDLYGYYVGDFIAEHMDNKKSPSYCNKINISIDSVQNNKIKGHSVVAGNNRPFAGSITPKGGLFLVKAKEPGDDQYDGVFEFTLDPVAHKVDGTWTANDKKLAVTYRHYSLPRMQFKYNPQLNLTKNLLRMGGARVYGTYDERTNKSESITSDACKFNASTTALSSRDVENMYKRDLEVTRNAIYARHGYSFQNRDMRYFFDIVNWYIPVSTDVSNQLTELERRNIELLKRYENHAASYYDRFGR